MPYLNESNYATYADFFKDIRNLVASNKDLPAGMAYDAFVRAGGSYWMNNPDIQNARVKAVNTLPHDFTKKELSEMVANIDGNERAIRQATRGLVSSTYQLKKIVKTYQDISQYAWYVYPSYITSEDTGKPEFMREYFLAQKTIEAMDIELTAHKIKGQVMESGKVYYYLRCSIDKSHNKVNYAYWQQLPEDWCKITGYNSLTGYTLMFDMMYFMQPGADPFQFGDLFSRYWPDFNSALVPWEGNGISSRYVTASKSRYGLDIDKMKTLAEAPGSPTWERNGFRWYYWVTLPPTKGIFVFESDDTTVNAITPLSGLLPSMAEIGDYEATQLEIALGKITSIMTGEIPYMSDDKGINNSDPYKLSPGGRRLFMQYWENTMAQYNMSGTIPLFLAPAENIKLQSVSDANEDINVASEYSAYNIGKAGLSALIPTSEDPRAGQTSTSATLESRYLKIVDWQLERAINWLFTNMGFKYTWKFHMFGSIFDRKEELERARQGMTLGLLTDTLIYLALTGHSLIDDISISSMINASGIMDMRKPLSSSFNSGEVGDGDASPEAAHDANPGGRPEAETVDTEGQEADSDRGV